jgi:hypothetical protein
MTLRPDPIPLLELIVALMISPAEREEDIVNLWTNPDLDPLRPELSTVPELDGHGSAPEAAPGSEQLGTSLGKNTDVTALGRTGTTGDSSTGGQTRGNPDSSAEPANTLSHSPTTAALFTVNASAALYRDEDKDVRATILLPSDDIIWEQLVAGCWSSQEASRATVSASSSSSSAGPLSNVPKLIPDNEEDTKDPTSPPMEYLPNEVKAYSPTLDRHELAPWPVGPLIKKSHLDLGSYDPSKITHERTRPFEDSPPPAPSWSQTIRVAEASSERLLPLRIGLFAHKLSLRSLMITTTYDAQTLQMITA